MKKEHSHSQNTAQYREAVVVSRQELDIAEMVTDGVTPIKMKNKVCG